MKVHAIKDDIYNADIYVIPKCTPDDLIRFFKRRYKYDYEHDATYGAFHYQLSEPDKGWTHHFLIFDEYVAFMEMLGNKENTTVLNKLKRIVMLGRQAGFFLILACQRPDAKYLGDGIRDQFNFRVALGRMSEMGYGMMFGSDVQKDFFLKQIKGRGYVDVGTSVISEFYTPLVPKGYNFLKNISDLTGMVNEDS